MTELNSEKLCTAYSLQNKYRYARYGLRTSSLLVVSDQDNNIIQKT